MPKPQPIPKSVICDQCGLDWGLHKKATLTECVRLLKAELVKRPQWSWTQYSGAHTSTGPLDMRGQLIN